jgi:hypothetical protein
MKGGDDGVGKFRLGHAQALADALDVNIGGDADFVASALARKASTSSSPAFISSNMLAMVISHTFKYCVGRWQAKPPNVIEFSAIGR